MFPQGDPLYRELVLDRDGRSVEDHISELLDVEGLTDIVVLAHGWNNNLAEARELFGEWIAGIRRHVDRHPDQPLRATTVGFIGVLWPSKRFEEADLIAGGAASLGAQDAAAVTDELTALATTLGGDDRRLVEEAAALVPRLESSAEARDTFVRSLVKVAERGTDADDAFRLDAQAVGGETLADLVPMNPDDVDPVPEDTDRPSGGAAGGPTSASPEGEAASFGLRSLIGAARRLANFTTFYVMKERAGLEGERGVAPALRGAVGTANPPAVRWHFVGHSFGARLVTAAAAALASEGEPPIHLRSLTLLQGAFSHYSFASRWRGEENGSFRDVVTSGIVDGPILVSHTRRDVPVGIAYAVASRWRNQVANVVGGATDPFGGLGSNGAVKTPEVSPSVTALLETDAAYKLADRALHNLHGGDFITGHGAVRGPEVTWALASALMHGAARP